MSIETTEKPKTLREGIASGHFDSVLDLLIEAAELRKRRYPERVLKAQRDAGTAKTGSREIDGITWNIGDIHQLEYNMKPAYVGGARVQILAFERKRNRRTYSSTYKIKVKIIGAIYGGKRFKTGDTITLKPSMINPKALNSD